ncbi:hypothetical protein [Xanthomarina gelatinilytica]|jgi:hypothetical protein|uniref:hypothetical protein n=1 Tax=Xanthomarina gelatinilytica TaxID=1137281 RepID=UPI003AA97F0D
MKIKFLPKLIIILLLNLKCFSQQSNEVRTYFGFIDSKLLRSENFDGGASYSNENSYEFGVKYLKKLTPKLSLETGINFMSSNVKISPNLIGANIEPYYENLKMISIPMFINYSIGKYFFLNGGPVLDVQNSTELFDSQSGFGYGIGFGGKYSFEKFLIYLNPNFKRHSVVPFEKENYHQKLTEFGIQLGIGYKF